MRLVPPRARRAGSQLEIRLVDQRRGVERPIAISIGVLVQLSMSDRPQLVIGEFREGIEGQTGWRNWGDFSHDVASRALFSCLGRAFNHTLSKNMRIHKYVPAFLIVVLLLASACADRGLLGNGSPPARDQINAAYKAMEKAFQEGNSDLVAASYAQDAELYAPSAPVIKGRQAIGRAWKDNGGSGGNRLHVDVAEVEESGNRADEVGRFTISGPDGAVLTAGTHLVVWARQVDGTWKARRGIFNWDIPPSGAEHGGVR